MGGERYPGFGACASAHRVGVDLRQPFRFHHDLVQGPSLHSDGRQREFLDQFGIACAGTKNVGVSGETIATERQGVNIPGGVRNHAGAGLQYSVRAARGQCRYQRRCIEHQVLQAVNPSLESRVLEAGG